MKTQKEKQWIVMLEEEEDYWVDLGYTRTIRTRKSRGAILNFFVDMRELIKEKIFQYKMSRRANSRKY